MRPTWLNKGSINKINYITIHYYICECANEKNGQFVDGWHCVVSDKELTHIKLQLQLVDVITCLVEVLELPLETQNSMMVRSVVDST